jgi:PAS domain S-box-containing protein
MPNPHQARRRRFVKDTEHHRRVLEIAQVVSATVGGDFFRSVVEHLSNTLSPDCVYIAELTGGLRHIARTVAVYRDKAPASNFEQNLAGTASSQVLADGAVSLSADAARIFPPDPLLEQIAARGYVGLRLNDSSGQVMGLVALVSRERLPDLALVHSVLQTFAVRIAAELERKRSYESLRQSEERYRAFIHSSLDAMWRIELQKPVPLDLDEEEQIARIYHDGYVAECNPATARLMGAATAEDLVGTPFADLFSRSHPVSEELRSFVKSGYSATTVEVMSPNSGGQHLRLRSQCGIVENNHLLRIWGTTRDLTELRRAEAAAEASDRRFRQVLETVRLPAVILDTRGKIMFCNKYLARLSGWSVDELTCSSWLDLIDSAPEREIWTALLSVNGRSPQHHEHIDGCIKMRDGDATPVAWDAILLRQYSGDPAGWAAIGRDDRPNSQSKHSADDRQKRETEKRGCEL